MNHRLAPAADRQVSTVDNLPPTDANPLLERLNENHRDILDKAAALEAKAASLPKTEDIKSDDQVEKIDGWVRDATLLTRTAEAERKEAKQPYLEAGRTIDSFFGDLNKGLADRIKAISARKKPYLVAKADRERAEREARERAQREEADRQRREAEAAEARAREAREAAEAEAERVRRAEAERVAANLETDAGRADEMTEAIGDYSADNSQDAAARHQQALAAAQEAERQAAEARKAAAASEKDADRAARDLAGGGHRLAKTGASNLKKVWRYRVTDEAAFRRAILPLGQYLGEGDITDALARWAKDLERPAIPGVEAYEDYDASTHVRR